MQLAGARVREGDLTAAARAYREAEPRAPFEERAGIQSRLGWLNKEMGNPRTAQRYFGRARTGVFTPYVTYAIIAITSIVSLFVLLRPEPDERRPRATCSSSTSTPSRPVSTGDC